MRPIITLSTILSASIILASAETNCNPSYNVPSSGECFTNCNIKAGSKFIEHGFTMDPTSPYFLESLKLMCTKGTPEYMAFMTQGGMCMSGCKEDPKFFVDEFAAACSWYAEHKNDQCASSNNNNNNNNNSTITSNSSSSTEHETSIATPTSSIVSPSTTPEPTQTNEANTNNDSNLASGSNNTSDGTITKLHYGVYAISLFVGAAYIIF